MRINTLPAWAQLAIVSAPYFGSEDPVTPATIENPPEEKPEGEKSGEDPVENEEAIKAIRERDQLKAERDALAQEKTEREEAAAQAKAATQSKEENLTQENSQLKEDNQKLTLVNEQNLLDLSILRNKKYQWENPDIVAKLIDRSNVKIDPKKGTVEGVDDALKALAKENPYLLKKSEPAGGGDNPAGVTIPGQPSGGKPGSPGDSSAKANKRKAVVDRFQVLNI